MRLIDAEKLVDMLYDNEFAVLCPLDEVSGVVDACPTVDAVPAVRCRDCKHFREYITVGTVCTKYVKSLGGREVGLRATGKDDFCSYGERKEGSEC